MKQFLLFLILFNLFTPQNYAQGKIDKAEKSLENTSKKGNSSSKSFYSNSSNNSEDNFFTKVVTEVFVKLFAYTAYAVAFESPFETKHKGHNATLIKHPYKNNNTGNYSYTWNEDSEIFTTSLTNRFIFETNKVYGNHLNMDMKFLKRWGLELDYLQLWEENTNFGDNTLAIYTALIKYHRVRTERFNASWGLGAASVDGDVNELGFTYALGAELFLIKPISIETNFNQTTINSNSVNKFNGLLNYHAKQYKFSFGYEHLKIGSVGFSNISIGTGVSF